MNTKRIAVITGANKGLGFATARELAKQGCRVVLTARDEQRGQDAAKRLQEENLDVTFMLLDVGSPQNIDAFCQKAVLEFKRIDILVNNAGVMLDESLDGNLTRAANNIDKTFKINALGPYLLCTIIVPLMVKNGYGRVVNMSSGLGQLTGMGSGYPGYRMSKTAINAVTRIFSSETQGKDVLVNSVAPGWVKTDMGGSNAPRSIEEGIKGMIWAATLPKGGPNGGFFEDGKRLDF